MFLRFLLQVTLEGINTGMKSPLRGKGKRVGVRNVILAFDSQLYWMAYENFIFAKKRIFK
jgi:hypothetical protein